MKKIVSTFFTIVLVFLIQTSVPAQNPSNVRILSAVKDCNEVKITLGSDTPFRFGDNKYYLHIGQKAFSKNKQRNENDGSGSITFHIHEKDFDLLPEGSLLWLSYGNLLSDFATEEEIKAAASELPAIITFLGNFSKNILSN
ncbi:MAG: hypothetical protein ACKVPJ_04150 [Chitinophagales bacterium]